jgi:hypothetical protein
MLGWFPTLFKEELLYSGVARFAEVMGFSIAGMWGSVFGAEPHTASANFPTELASFVRRLPPGHPMTVADIIDRHTPLPFFEPFVDPSTSTKVRNVMTQGSSSRSVGKLLGISRDEFLGPEYLQFCPACAAQDAIRTGFSFWHRVHQLPGVVVCPTHERALFRIPAISSWGQRFIPLNPRNIDSGEELRFPAQARPHLVRVAQAAQWLLEDRPRALGTPELRERLMRYVNGYGSRFVPTIDAFVEHIGRSTIGLLGRQWFFGGEAFGTHPMCYVMILDLLGVSIAQFFEDPFRPGASSEGVGILRGQHPSSSENTQAMATSSRRRALTVICSSCGFSYLVGTNDMWAIRVLANSDAWSIEERRLRRSQKDPLEVLVSRLGFAPETLRRHAEGKCTGRPAPEWKSVIDRARWIKVTKCRKMNRGFLVRLSPSVYRVAEIDEDSRHKRNVRVHRRTRIDWRVRDAEWTKKAQIAIDEILASREPRWVSKSEVVGVAGLGSRVLNYSYISKLPRLSRLLERETESFLEFARRRLMHTVNR